MRWFVCISSFWVDGLEQMILQGQVFACKSPSFELPMPASKEPDIDYYKYWKEIE